VEEILDLFQPIAPLRAYQVVINQLEEVILSGKLEPGDKLPPERVLIESLGTSRRTLREAFRVLEQKGLLEIKIGSKGGTFVADRMHERLGETLGMLLRAEQVTQLELAEFRSSTESRVAALAAERASTKEISNLERAVDNVAALLEPERLDRQRFIDMEVMLHQHLVRICGNAVYGPILTTINQILLYPMWEKDPIDWEYVKTAVRDWRDLLGALRKRDADAAAEIMRRHISHFDGLDG
jgi:DNA-binding FadR family transcriptional regulator